jgi:glycosyltransferase involved in cell wall biosynthesis
VELRAVRRFHACTTVAEADAEVVRKLAPGVPVRVTPNGVDAAYFAPMAVPEQPETIIFTGAMSFPPNVTAVLYFYQHILPLIRRELPNVRFVVAGRDPAPQIVALASDPFITVTGFVEDMRPWLAQANLMVCPMVMGSGIKNKVLEGLAMARPVVATKLGVEALEVTDGRELAVADTPESFAATTLALLRDAEARRRMGAAGRELVLRRYTWDACAASYDALYTQLAARRGGAPRLAALRDKAV